ncbi:hypothetical protein [Salimicrobium halophilum]|nr:hypothetical protein [Salimicrobium halophilum]
MSEKFERKLEKRLKEETDNMEKQKQETWSRIESELFTGETKKKRTPWVATAVAATLILLIVAASIPDLRQPVVNSVKELFVEEKEQNINIEGQEEETDVQRNADEEWNYVIYVDEDRYRLEEGEGVDRIIPATELGEAYPEVSMMITETEATPGEIESEMTETYPDYSIESEQVTTPQEATELRAVPQGATEWNTPIYRWYVIEGETTYVVKQNYFLEAAEGHGARFDAMLETFEIVEEE